MQDYYNKPELTNKVLDEGWVHTGDIFSINEDGILFLWGRADDKTVLPNKQEMYLFDIANKLKTDKDVADAFVNAMPLENGESSLVAHIVFKDTFTGDRITKYLELDTILKDFLPKNVSIDGYKEHYITFKCSPTTVKKDRKGLMKELDGCIKPTNDGVYSLSYDILDNNKLIKRYTQANVKRLKREKRSLPNSGYNSKY